MKTKLILKPIDLSKTIVSKTKRQKGRKYKQSDGEQTTHPDIKPGNIQYLCKIDGRFYGGTFSMEWYGLNFDGLYDAGLQFDPPGVNHSYWQAIWEIIESKKTIRRKNESPNRKTNRIRN